MSKLAIFLLLVLTLTTAVSSASVQSHPFSELFPPDESLGFGGNNIENVSRAELSEIVPSQSDIIFRDSGDISTLTWDESEGEWRVNGVDLNLSGNSVTNVRAVNGGGSAINVNDVLQLNSNSVNGLNNLGFNGGNTYIIQNSDGDNVLLQADDSSGNRNNFMVVDPDNQVTSFPTGNVQVSNGNLNLNSNSLTNFFGSPCSTGNVMVDVNSDGSYDCVNAADEVQDTYVNRNGDSMTGNLDMQDNQIANLDLQNVNNLEMDGDIEGTGYDMSITEVAEILGPANGDSDLNIQTQGSGSQVVSIEDGSSSNSDIARFEEGTQNLVIPNGNLDLNGNSLNSFFGSACSTGNVMVDVNSDGSYDCVNAADEVQDTYVNRNGDSMTGNLDMQDNQITNFDQLRTGQGGRVMTFNNPSGGSSEIRFRSGTNTGSDYAYIEYFDDYTNSGEAGRLKLGIENDGSTDDIEISAAGDVRLNPNNGSNAGTGGNIILQGSNADLDVNGNSINNFFGSACSTGNVMVDVNSDGSYDCVNAADEVQDTYVNRNGDTMTGDLDMQSNNILIQGLVDGVDVGSTGNAITTDASNRYAVSSNSIALSELDEGSVDTRYVQLSGDRMEGSLDMDGYNINNFFGSACSSGKLVAHVNDDGSLDCVNAADEVQDTYVNRNGDSMTGNLDMSGNNVNNVNTINNGGTTLNVGSTVQASGDLQTGSGTVTSSSEMCIGNQC